MSKPSGTSRRATKLRRSRPAPTTNASARATSQGDERRPQAAAPRRQGARAARHLAERPAAYGQDRGGGGRGRRHERQDQREAERGRVQGGFAEPRYVAGRERDQQRNAGEGAEHAECPAQRAEHQALRHDAAGELRGTRAEDHAQGHLGRALAELDELQGRDVGAGHEQDEADAAEQGEERGARGAEHGIGERRQDGGHAVRLVLLEVVARDERCHVAPRLLQRDPGLEAPERAHPPDAGLLHDLAHAGHDRRPQLGARGIDERLRHHAHDGEGLPIEHDRGSDDARVRAEARRATARGPARRRGRLPSGRLRGGGSGPAREARRAPRRSSRTRAGPRAGRARLARVSVHDWFVLGRPARSSKAGLPARQSRNAG